MLHFETIPRSQFFERSSSDALLREVADLREVTVGITSKVGYLLLNRHLIGEAPAIVSVGAFMSDVTTPDRAWEGVNLAGLERPVLMLDLPGHGLSTAHSLSQTVDLCIKRDADSQARPLTDAVQKLLDPNDTLDYFGISHGGFMSLKMTEQDPGDRVGTIFGIDVPAVTKRSTLGLQFGYVVKDNVVGRKKYLDQLSGTPQAQDWEKFKLIHESMNITRAPSFVQNNTGLFMLNLIASINARPRALESWAKIMKEKSTTIHVVTSAEGSISSPSTLADFISNLPESERFRSKQCVIEGEDHNIAIVHLMPRAVEWARRAYSG